MRIAIVTIMIALMATPALAQRLGKGQQNQEATVASQQDKAKKKEIEEAYRRALNNIPDVKSSNDPWRGAR